MHETSPSVAVIFDLEVLLDVHTNDCQQLSIIYTTLIVSNRCFMRSENQPLRLIESMTLLIDGRERR